MQARLSCLAAAGACALLVALPAGPSIAQSQPTASGQLVQAPAKDAAPAQAAAAPAPANAEAPAQPAVPPQPVEAGAPAKDAAPAQATAASAPAKAEAAAQPAAPTQPAQTQAPAKDAAPAQAAAAAVPDKVGTPAQAVKDEDKTLVGLDVFSSEGQQIGKVSKVDQSNGKPASIVVESKGFLGYFKKTYVVPADAIKTKAGRIDLSITGERIAQLKQ
jgi:sporulation protein YlmC with PRC-barrel domain